MHKSVHLVHNHSAQAVHQAGIAIACICSVQVHILTCMYTAYTQCAIPALCNACELTIIMHKIDTPLLVLRQPL